ncbi:MAG: hypothetical protein IJS73_08235 [Paludibacteraceae bacterium]|nr:hypothetical protein [Paludibacteraceae bacterium]
MRYEYKEQQPIVRGAKRNRLMLAYTEQKSFDRRPTVGRGGKANNRSNAERNSRIYVEFN